MNKQEATNTAPLSVKFQEEPIKETKEKLKKLNLKWNSFRKEFYGYGVKKEVEETLIGLKCNVEVFQE